MKTLYLHIGTAKTGTTAIQVFCNINRELLEEQSYCYPVPFYEPHIDWVSRNGNFLVAAVKDENRKYIRKEQERILREGMEETWKLFEKYDNIILSDETIWWGSSYLNPNLWETLKKEREKGQFTIKVIAYLRRQDDFVESHWNQQVKKDDVGRTCQEHLDYLMTKRPMMLDYAQKLEGIANCLGRENIIIRRFEPKEFEGGSIYRDFTRAVGITWREDFAIPPKQVNERLKGNYHEIQRILNNVSGLDKRENKFLENVLIKCSDDRVEKERYSMFSVEERKALMAKYEEGNRKIAEEYLKDGKPLFDASVKELPKWEKDNPEMYDDMIRFTAWAVAGIRRENEEIRQRNNELKEEIRTLKEKLKHPIRAGIERLRG